MRKVLAVLVAVSLLGIAPADAAVVKAGAKCSKHKVTTTVKGMKYTCIKTKKKLVRSKGVPVKKATDSMQGICPPISEAVKDPGVSQSRANALIGMSEGQAEECAMNLDWGFRVGQRDAEMFALTRDYRIDRVTVTVMSGFITKVGVG
jgi:hypothetical protein